MMGDEPDRGKREGRVPAERHRGAVMWISLLAHCCRTEVVNLENKQN